MSKGSYAVVPLETPKGSIADPVVITVKSGVHSNSPSACWCCCDNDLATMVYFDHNVFESPMGKAGVCDPVCYLCPHCCGCCGEVAYFRTPWPCVNMPPVFGQRVLPHAICCISVFTLFAGLEEGETVALNAVIGKQVMLFKGNSGTGNPIQTQNNPMM